MLLGLLSAPAVAAPEYIVNAEEALGGNAYEYLDRIQKFRKQGTMVVLPPECISSCTLYTILIRDGLVCTRSTTTLAFHKFLRRETRTVGEDGLPSSYWLDPPTTLGYWRTWRAYPRTVRRAVLARSPSGLPEPGNEVEVPAHEVGIPKCS